MSSFMKSNMSMDQAPRGSRNANDAAQWPRMSCAHSAPYFALMYALPTCTSETLASSSPSAVKRAGRASTARRSSA